MKFRLLHILVALFYMTTFSINQFALASESKKLLGEGMGLNYDVTGTRDGKVQIIERESSKAVRIFTMNRHHAVREIHVLDKGRVIAASQSNETVFWDITSGEELHHAPYRIYAFSPNQKNFFIYRDRNISWIAYPSFKDICKLTSTPVMGPDRFAFSPDGRFLIILFYSGRPSSDDNYPNPEPQSRSYRYARLFDVSECKEIEEFTALDTATLGKFSQDSHQLVLKDSVVRLGDRYVKGTWSFNLSSHQLQP